MNIKITREELLEILKKYKEDLSYCNPTVHQITYSKIYDIILLIKTNEIIRPLIESNQNYRDNLAQAIKGMNRYKTASSVKRQKEDFKKVSSELNPTLTWLINNLSNEK